MSRNLPSDIAAKIRLLNQTRAGGAEPYPEAIVTRNTVPLTDYRLWQTTVIPGINAAETDIAVKRSRADKGPEAVYAAVLEADTGGVFVYKAPFSGSQPPTAWTITDRAENATDMALAFEGRYEWRTDKRVEFVTIGEPWFFWVSGGTVYGKRIGNTESFTAATGVRSVDALMGLSSASGDVSQGLVLAYITASDALFTKQYYGGLWESAQFVSAAPPGLTDLALSRTWDYRLSLQLRGLDGKLWQLLGRSVISGNANQESIVVQDISHDIRVKNTLPAAAQGREHIVTEQIEADTRVYGTIAPVMLSAANIADKSGDWNTLLRIVFDREVYSLAGSEQSFMLAGSYGSGSLSYDTDDKTGRTLIARMAYFGNAPSQSVLTYTPGSLESGPGVTPVAAQLIPVTLANLTPVISPQPVEAEASDSYHIRLAFDTALQSGTQNPAAFRVTGYEPAWSPGGEAAETEYTVSAVTAEGAFVTLTLFGNGRLKYPQGSVTLHYYAASGTLAGTNGIPAESFSFGFVPDRERLSLMFHPHPAEYIAVSAAYDIIVGRVSYADTEPEREHMNVTDIAYAITVQDTSNNPV